MKMVPTFRLIVLSLALGLFAGCASTGSHSAAVEPASQKKGHWVTLPPVTGSHISQRVWVYDSGHATNSPSANNVQTGSAGDLERMQRNSGGSSKNSGP